MLPPVPVLPKPLRDITTGSASVPVIVNSANLGPLEVGVKNTLNDAEFCEFILVGIPTMLNSSALVPVNSACILVKAAFPKLEINTSWVNVSELAIASPVTSSVFKTISGVGAAWLLGFNKTISFRA